jgi:class 3 adenylate cyclase/tetratricopeptide (TPR) repeat protein
MQCPRCHAENRVGRRFCGECGLSLAWTCPACGFLNEGNEKFCGGCGADVAPGGATERSSPSPQSYTPKHLAERILTSKAALEGERKQVTVLFADLKGSMELLADRDPEEARKILDPVLELMMEAVHRYEGTVNQVMGDGIMALFGAPLAHEDHAVRGCYAALRMQERVKRYAEEARSTHGIDFQIRVGLNSGEVLVRAIGGDVHMDYTAIGETTHLAARMEQMATPASILATRQTISLVEGYIEARALGRRAVKGLTSPIDVYEVTHATGARSRLQAAVGRDLTPFLGRQSEMNQLGQALKAAAAGHGQLVAVVGEAGVGKSRLFWELTQICRTESQPVLECGSVSYGQATPYLPLIALLKAYFGIEPRDDSRTRRRKVADRLLAVDLQVQWAMPAFLWLLDLEIEDSEWHRLDPPQRRQVTLEAIRQLLLHEARVQPLVVIFEDLHWTDSETQALLDSLVDSISLSRVLLLVSHRPDYRHAWSTKTYYRQLRIDPLPPAEAEAVLESLLGSDPALHELKRRLIERTERNPFFLEETVRALMDAEVLVGQRGALRLAADWQNFRIPSGIRAVLAARLDRLSPEDKRLLQAASVIGPEVSLKLVAAIVDDVEEHVREQLGRLQAAEFVSETSLFPDWQYTFRHALTREVVYASVTNERRKKLHNLVLEILERLCADNLAEQVPRLAEHAVSAENWGKAVLYLREAGSKALGRSANADAARYFERTLAALRRLPESTNTVRCSIDVRFDLRNALFPLGRFAEAYEHLRTAEALAVREDDLGRLGWIYIVIAHYFWLKADLEDAGNYALRADDISRSLSDAEMSAAAAYYRGTTRFAAGDYVEASVFFERTIRLLTGSLQGERCRLAGYPSAMARAFLVYSKAELGAFAEGIAAGRETLALADELGHPYTSALAYCWVGHLYLGRGELSQAIPLLEYGRATLSCRARTVRPARDATPHRPLPRRSC